MYLLRIKIYFALRNFSGYQRLQFFWNEMEISGDFPGNRADVPIRRGIGTGSIIWRRLANDEYTDAPIQIHKTHQ